MFWVGWVGVLLSLFVCLLLCWFGVELGGCGGSVLVWVRGGACGGVGLCGVVHGSGVNRITQSLRHPNPPFPPSNATPIPLITQTHTLTSSA